MPPPDSEMQDATVIDFISRMNQDRVEYAVMRNYEAYPNFGHDVDLVVRWSDLPRWKEIATACAEDHGWSVLTECDHWARSSSREHIIHILRFYSVNPRRYLQIDAFHSFLSLGLPLFDEDALLRDRIRDERGFYRINEAVENCIRLFQIAKLAGMKGTEKKLARYGDRALAFWKSTPDLAINAQSFGFPKLLVALDWLEAKDFKIFKKEIDRQKRVWLIKQILTRPIYAGKMICDRAVDYARLFLLRPCGFNLRAYASDEMRRKVLGHVLRELAGTNMITHFTLKTGFKDCHKVLERGGIVVKWVSAKSAEIVSDQKTDEHKLSSELLERIIERHPRLFDQRITTD